MGGEREQGRRHIFSGSPNSRSCGASWWHFMHERTGRDPAKAATVVSLTRSPRETLTRSRAARRLRMSVILREAGSRQAATSAPPILIPDKRLACSEGTTMRSLTLSACVLVAFLSGVGLLLLALHPQYELAFEDPWPLAFMGVG